jgi:hypothetical protein
MKSTKGDAIMATRTTMGRTVLREIPKRVGKVQAEAEKALGRGYRATLKALPAGPRKVVREFAEQIEETADDLTRRGKRTLRTVEQRGKTLTGRVEKAVEGLQKRGKKLVGRFERAFADLGRRRDRALKTATKQVKSAVASLETSVAGLERRTVGAINPIVQRLEIATHADLEKLSRRVAQLERKNGRRTKLAA